MLIINSLAMLGLSSRTFQKKRIKLNINGFHLHANDTELERFAINVAESDSQTGGYDNFSNEQIDRFKTKKGIKEVLTSFFVWVISANFFYRTLLSVQL